MPLRAGQWEEVETALMADIVSGRLAPGDRLPPEADLCARFRVGRHSLRRAVAALASAGRLRVVQGSGTYVTERALLLYEIGRRTRFTRNLVSQGFTPSGELDSATTAAAPGHVADALGVGPDTPVHALVSVGRADGVPVSLTRSWHLADLFPDLPARRRAGNSITEIYAEAGFSDYRRRETTITARFALRSEARRLHLPDARPVLVTSKTDVDARGRPIGHSEGVWAADRVKFAIDTDTGTGAGE